MLKRFVKKYKGLKFKQLPKSKKKKEKGLLHLVDTYLEHPTSLAMSVIFIACFRNTLQEILSSVANGAIMIDSCDI